MYIIMLLKQFLNIEEYVKFELQISVRIICNHYNYCIYFIERFDLDFIENKFLITSLC
jgi:hypothetical protein